jgi:hypothetical protein
MSSSKNDGKKPALSVCPITNSNAVTPVVQHKALM